MCSIPARSLVVAALLLAGAAAARAQSGDVVASARSAATSGHRAEALGDLERHLRESPRDVDARLLYGLVLSWEGRYDDARRELGQVLVQTPSYNDARVALANIAWWNGDYPELKRLVDEARLQRPDDVEWQLLDARALDGLGQPREARRVLQALLAQAPGYPRARVLKNRLDASLRPWSLTAGYVGDRFSDQRTPWAEYSVALSRQTPVGSVIGRVSQVERFGLGDRLFEVEMYPTFRPGTYAYVGVGVAKDERLYPGYRVATDLYQSLGGGFEASAGFRRLGFAAVTDIYVGTLTKYTGSWMLTGKAMYVPDRDGPEDAVSYHAVVRRYVGGSGESWIGGGFSHGYSREELGDSAELQNLDADTVRLNAEILVHPRWLVAASASTSRQERARRQPLWQHSVGASVTVYF
ncbi:MAG: YaiO family outer membrane beta-barrel protein [Vicinamibacterales bacterium]